MAITTTSVLGDTTPTVIEEAKYTAQHTAISRPLAWVIKKKRGDGTTVNIPYFGTVTAVSLTQGVDMASPTSMADTNVQITPAEVGCQIMVTDKLVRDNQEDVIRAAGRILGDAMAVKQDGDWLGQMDDAVSGHALGGSTTTLTLGMLAAGRALLKGVTLANGGPAPGRYAAIHHPYVWLDLVDILTPLLATTTATYQGITAGGGVIDEVLREYTIGRLFGMPCIEAGNLTISSSAAKGGIVSVGNSIVLAIADEWSVVEDPDPSLRATELNVVGEYGVGEYLDDWLVELHDDATTPT